MPDLVKTVNSPLERNVRFWALKQFFPDDSPLTVTQKAMWEIIVEDMWEIIVEAVMKWEEQKR